MQQGRRSDDGRQGGNAGSGLEKQSEKVVRGRKSEKEGWSQEVAENGYGTSKSVESAGSGNGTYRKIKTEKANGGSSG